MQNIHTELIDLLKHENKLAIDGHLNNNKIVELALQIDSCAKIKAGSNCLNENIAFERSPTKFDQKLNVKFYCRTF